MAYDYVMVELGLSSGVTDEEPTQYIKEFEGTVYAYSRDRKTRAGRITFFIIDVELAITEEESAFEVFDSRSATLTYWELYKDDLEYSDAVQAVIDFEDFASPNLLILDRIEINPRYRGQGIGLDVLRWITRQFSLGCGLVAMKPFPLQFEGGPPADHANDPRFKALRLDSFDTDYCRALAKLRAHYEKLGFAQVPGTDLMVTDPWRYRA